MTESDLMLVEQTASIVRAVLGGQAAVAVDSVPKLIADTHRALSALGQEAVAEAAPAGPVPAVSIKASLKTDGFLISMIDGKPYKMLRRHIKLHGYTDGTYRAAFGLPANYPMTAPAYSEKRRALAITNGLGRNAQKVSPAQA